MIKIISVAILLTFVFLFVSRSTEAGFFSFKHTVAIIVGDTKTKVLSQAEHILIRPKDVTYAFQGTSDEVEVRRYIFTEGYDLVLCFYKDVFLEANLVDPNSNDYPAIRPDYKSVHKGSPGPVGYLITKDSRTLSIKVLH